MPDTEQGKFSLMSKIGFFASTLVFTRRLDWPSKVCKDCAEDTNRTGELGFYVTAAFLALGLISFLVAKHYI
jgi:hypothetical protein